MVCCSLSGCNAVPGTVKMFGEASPQTLTHLLAQTYYKNMYYNILGFSISNSIQLLCKVGLELKVRVTVATH